MELRQSGGNANWGHYAQTDASRPPRVFSIVVRFLSLFFFPSRLSPTTSAKLSFSNASSEHWGLMTPCFPTETFNQRLITRGGPTHSAELDLIFHFFSSASHIYQSAVQRRRTKKKRLFIRRLTSAGAAGRSARDVGEHRGGLARKHVVVAICFSIEFKMRLLM